MTTQNYIGHYTKIDKVYPSAFALKVFLGKFPDFNFRDVNFTGKKILDLGFGDGRDMVLFHDLGFDVSGVEPEAAVVEHRKQRFEAAGIKADLKPGTNMEIPFDDEYFDFLYSSAAMYYMPSETHSIENALREANRVLKPGGHLITSFVTSRAHYIPSAEKIKNNLYKLTDPFFNQRKGQLIHAYDNEIDLKIDLVKINFVDIHLGSFEVNWFGVPESLILVVAKKA